jgi:hypothetical protein
MLEKLFIGALMVLLGLVIASHVSANKEIKTLTSQADSLRAVATAHADSAGSWQRVARTMADSASKLRAKRPATRTRATALPPLPVACDTLLALIDRIEFERDNAWSEADAWKVAYDSEHQANLKLWLAVDALEKADSTREVAVEVAEKKVESLFSKLRPHPSLGAIAGGCLTPQGGISPCIGVGLSVGWRF